MLLGGLDLLLGRKAHLDVDAHRAHYVGQRLEGCGIVEKRLGEDFLVGEILAHQIGLAAGFICSSRNRLHRFVNGRDACIFALAQTPQRLLLLAHGGGKAADLG